MPNPIFALRLLACAIVGVAFCAGSLAPAQDVALPQYQVRALEYARSDEVATRRLVAGASGRSAMSWYFFLLSRAGHHVLVDVGTDRFSERLGSRRSWSVVWSQPVVEALSATGVEPTEIDDVVLTHHHWDHVEGLRSFSNAAVHVHRAEWPRVPSHVRIRVRASRLRFFSGSGPILPGVAVLERGVHTRHSVMVRVGCRGGSQIVLAGDAAYLYRNLEEPIAVAVSANRTRNLHAIRRTVREFGLNRVFPGHDPEIFARHPGSGRHVANLCSRPRRN